MVGAPEVAENIMNWTHWLGLPALGSAHGGQIDALSGRTHVFMLVLFVGWGGVFIYAPVRFPRSRPPVTAYPGVKTHPPNYFQVALGRGQTLFSFPFSIT